MKNHGANGFFTALILLRFFVAKSGHILVNHCGFLKHCYPTSWRSGSGGAVRPWSGQVVVTRAVSHGLGATWARGRARAIYRPGAAPGCAGPWSCPPGRPVLVLAAAIIGLSDGLVLSRCFTSDTIRLDCCAGAAVLVARHPSTRRPVVGLTGLSLLAKGVGICQRISRRGGRGTHLEGRKGERS